MGLTSGALEWWEEWQLRVLVLSSLFVQFILFFSIWVSRVPALRKLRVVVWMAYIGGDALAIYALATLFNRHRQPTTDVVDESKSRSSLEVLWAPVLLIHLGGQVTLSAFSLEDNELWLRHVITVVSQVTVALYVFCKWWSGELKLLLAGVMLFVFGIFKSVIKPWALRRASYSQMLASTDVSLCSVEEKKEGDGATGDKALSLDEYVKKAKAMMCAASCDQQAVEEPTVEMAATSSDDESEPISIRHICYFADLSVPYVGRLSDLQYLQNPPPAWNDKFEMENTPYNILQKCFARICDKLYSREGYNTIEEALMFLLPLLALASVVLFAMSHKDGYNSRDVKVTYILFSCTTMVELLPHLTAIALVLALACIPRLKFLYEYLSGWHDMVSQYDLMSFYVRKKKPTFLMKLVFFECLREYVSKFWYVRQVPAAREITELVQRHIEDGWKTFITDAVTYKRFGNFRGQLTLNRFSHQQCDLGEELWDSLEVPFDKSILLWHMATNLCFHRPVDKPSSFLRSQSDLTQRSMEMSNYMLYLLFIRTEMLLPGTRPGLFSVAIYELEAILKKKNKEKLESEEAVAQEIIKHTDGSSLIHEACRLAVSLMMKLDEEEMWQIIQGVWVEMLCYSASRCRGLLHAKSLGEGGEYLSYVWLLWSFMGMETLPDKLQKPESSAQREIIHVANGLASPSNRQTSTSAQREINGLASPSSSRLNRQTSTSGILCPV